jgi:carbamoyltransferase
MAYNILGIHPGHNGSSCLLSDGELICYLEEERLSKVKYDHNNGLSVTFLSEEYVIDELVICGYYNTYSIKTHDKDVTQIDYKEMGIQLNNVSLIYPPFLKKTSEHFKITEYGQDHHLTHASSAFYNSGFNEAIAIIVDGSGTYKNIKLGEIIATGAETESIWECSYPNKFSLKYSVFGDNIQRRFTNDRFDVGSSVTITKAYEGVNKYLGFDALEGGKTMGLSSYGKPNSKIPSLFKDNRTSRDIFIPDYPIGSILDTVTNPQFQRNRNPKEFHRDFSKVLDIEKDLAWKVQQETQQKVGDLIEKALSLSPLRKIVIAGGYGLNCVANYYYKKRFPNVEFFIDPVSHDGGTSIGGTYLAWRNHSKDSQIRKLKTLYLGPKYSKDKILSSIKKYNNMFIQHTTTPEEVAKLISERNIVTIFQGRSEAGPRALGNRSILYDPTDPNGKDYVNRVKNREWFRPFAGTVLKEKAHEWFDMAGLEESPFMMYAMDVWPDKQEQIKAITHVDGTCRIQTITEEQNPHYYKLIQEFEKITGVPILFNTSFNLAGDPLVETIEDALETMLKSEMKYLYLPELEILLEVKNT